MRQEMRFLFVFAIVFFLLEFIFWKGVFHQMFSKEIVSIQRVVYIPKTWGLIAYFIGIFAMAFYLVIKPHESVRNAYFIGLLFFATMEAHNYAVLKNWNAVNSIIRSIWGSFAFGTSTYLAYLS